MAVTLFNEMPQRSAVYNNKYERTYSRQFMVETDDRDDDAEFILQYIVDLAEASRNHPDLALGASPRASLNLLRCARARALLNGRHYFTHEDIHAIARGVLAHRLIIRPEAEVEGKRVEEVVDDLIRTVPVLETAPRPAPVATARR